MLLDGAMGTMAQGVGPEEADYRGESPDTAKKALTGHDKLFQDQLTLEAIRSAEKPLRDNHDLLCFTRPDIVFEIRPDMLKAGADILTTNTTGAESSPS